jgi:predicted acylesterase/phospholipase RssA
MGQTRGALGRIGLCLSGGGYRAAAFHLGVLDLFQRAGLLADVTGLSTVSGGTFTGARWALALARGESFGDFYSRFYRFLDSHDGVDDALRALETAGADRPSGRHSLITAAAETYARPDFMGTDTFGVLFDRPTSLAHIIFNATELDTGVDFRFQRSEGSVIGNGNWQLLEAAARQARLADIVAASSCFPGGFEPLQFPEDFAWPGKAPPTPLWASKAAAQQAPQGLALVDGGVYDNLGLGALLLADRRGPAGPTFDLLFISDVDQKSDEPFFEFDAPAAKGWLRLQWLIWGLLLWTGFTSASATFLWTRSSMADLVLLRGWLERLGPMLIMFLCAIGPWLLIEWGRRLVPEAYRTKVAYLWSYLRRQRVREGVELGSLRLRSLVAITSSVFMKRIRGLGFRGVYSVPALRQRTVANFIYDLPEVGKAGEQAYPAWLLPTEGQLAQAAIANAMPTQLWFDEGKGELAALISTGQSTACFNLLEFIGRLIEKQSTPELLELQARLQELWKQLQAAPTGFVTAP